MRCYWFATIAFFSILASCSSAKNVRSKTCTAVIDSASFLIQTNISSVNIMPTINDKERNYRLDKFFQQLSFKNLTCLLDSKSVALKAVGFAYGSVTNRDSLLKQYSYLLIDTTLIQIFNLDGRISPAIKLGEYLTLFIQENNESSLARNPSVDSVLFKFITGYATYPASYRPISLTYYSSGFDDEGVESFSITHEYELKNNKGATSISKNSFFLEKELKIYSIDKGNDSPISSYQLSLEYWLKEFGRSLNRNDSLALRLQ